LGLKEIRVQKDRKALKEMKVLKENQQLLLLELSHLQKVC
jgi:hypothetical protein